MPERDYTLYIIHDENHHTIPRAVNRKGGIARWANTHEPEDMDFWEKCDGCGIRLGTHFGGKPPRPKKLWCPKCGKSDPNPRINVYNYHPDTMKAKKKTTKKVAAKPAKKKSQTAGYAQVIRGKRDTRPLEKDIEKKVCKYAVDTYSCYVRKFTSPQQRSVPDRIFITPTGRVFFIEFKRPAKGQNTLPELPTAGQLAEHDAIRKCKGKVHVVCDVEEGQKLIDEICFGF